MSCLERDGQRRPWISVAAPLQMSHPVQAPCPGTTGVGRWGAGTCARQGTHQIVRFLRRKRIGTKETT